MSNWSLPTLSSTYANFRLYLSDRLDDVATLFSGSPTNLPEGAIRYVRASNKFQEWVSAAWVDKVLAVAGGGTGAATAANARTNLGLGTMATQDANNVTITGGSVGAVSGSGITNLNADNLASGTVPNGRFPATLPAASGVNLTALNATNLASGTVPDARFPATLPAVSGVNLTALNGSNVASGTVAPARLGSGSPGITTFLRGDGSWQEPIMFSAHEGVASFGPGDTTIDYDISGLGISSATKMFVIGHGPWVEHFDTTQDWVASGSDSGGVVNLAGSGNVYRGAISYQILIANVNTIRVMRNFGGLTTNFYFSVVYR